MHVHASNATLSFVCTHIYVYRLCILRTPCARIVPRIFVFLSHSFLLHFITTIGHNFASYVCWPLRNVGYVQGDNEIHAHISKQDISRVALLNVCILYMQVDAVLCFLFFLFSSWSLVDCLTSMYEGRTRRTSSDIQRTQLNVQCIIRLNQLIPYLRTRRTQLKCDIPDYPTGVRVPYRCLSCVNYCCCLTNDASDV